MIQLTAWETGEPCFIEPEDVRSIIPLPASDGVVGMTKPLTRRTRLTLRGKREPFGSGDTIVLVRETSQEVAARMGIASDEPLKVNEEAQS